MNHIKLYLLLALTFTSLLAYAQDTTEEDPLAEYSYLWEDSKKDKKKKSKKNVTPVEEQTVLDTIPETEPLVQTDSLESNDTVTEDITDLTENIAVQDSLEQAIRDERRAKRQEKVSKKDDPEDFRAGLPPIKTGGSINAGITYSTIDGQAYVGMNINPEFSIGKVGVGMDIPILYGLDNNEFRDEMYKDGVGLLRMIRYVRYGQQKVDPIYVRVGSLTGTSIGYGGLVNNYSNETSYEKRKIGLHYDINYKGWGGIEGLYSDFDASSMNLFAIRPYVKPLRWLPTPIIRTLEIGTTFVKDRDQTELLDEDALSDKYRLTKDGVGGFGIDAGMTLFRIPFVQIDLFANFSRLNVETQALNDTLDFIANEPSLSSDLDLASSSEFKKGTGASVGLNFRLNFIADILNTDIRIERLSYSDYYIPQFFDAGYEINKDAKILSVAGTPSRQGIYGSVNGHILKTVSLGGSLMMPDNISEESPATITLHADVDRLADKVSIHANYFKGGLTDLSDAFKLDERSLAKVRFAYHLNKFMMAGLDYFWLFTPTENGYKATRYISPFFGVSIQL